MASVTWGQRGDRTDTAGQTQHPPSFPIPPSPALSPAEAVASFQVAPGFRIELVASEPLVVDPVAIAFDPDGRIWVVEMRGWMNDVDGGGNDQPIGQIVTLEDTNGDGRMDRSTVFMDALVMPRAIQVAREGGLVGAPPYLWFCRDTNGDGRADEKTVVTDDYMNFPEGALYVIDMYRRIIEYIHVMTTYLRRQILEQGLDRPLGRGRIYRILPNDRDSVAPSKTSALNSDALLATLSDANGWRRDTAQRLLVERADSTILSELKKLARSAPGSITRLHALWTLEGLNGLDDDSLLAALADPADKIRAAASEPWLRRTLDRGRDSEITLISAAGTCLRQCN
jgi:hypothetical protein